MKTRILSFGNANKRRNFIRLRDKSLEGKEGEEEREREEERKKGRER